MNSLYAILIYVILGASALIVILAILPIPLWISRALRGGKAKELDPVGGEQLLALPAPVGSLVREIEETHMTLTLNLPVLADYASVAGVASAFAGASSNGWLQSLVERQSNAEREVLEALDSVLIAFGAASETTRESLESSGYTSAALREKWLASRALAIRDDVVVEQHPGSAPGNREIKDSLRRYETAARDLEAIRAALLKTHSPYRD